MKWFYNLSRRVRNIIAGVSWGVVVVATAIVGGVYGGNTENANPAVAVVVVALCAVAIVFTVFAAKATSRERAADRQAQAEKQAAERASRLVTLDSSSITSPPDDDVVRVRVGINNGVDLPVRTKAVGVTFDDCQENIAESIEGDGLIIKHAPRGQYTESTDIINARTGGRVGRIKKELAFELLDAFGAGFALDGEITDITGGTDDAPTYGCNIIILNESGAQ